MLPDSRVSDNVSYLRGNVMRAEREREREREREERRWWRVTGRNQREYLIVLF